MTCEDCHHDRGLTDTGAHCFCLDCSAGHDDYYRRNVLDVCPSCGVNAYFENVRYAGVFS